MIDLHVHTTLSDGIYTPEELVKKAIGEDINVLCMTDHNTVNEGLGELREKYPQITLPTGCEFSCKYTTVKNRVIQVHIGGIGFDMFNKKIQKILSNNQNSMRPYIEKILARLKEECGIDLCTYEELRSRSTAKSLGRKHVAVELVRQGIAENIDDAFDSYLGNNRPAHVSNAESFADLSDVAAAVTEAGGIASVCHLFYYNLDIEETDDLLKNFKRITGDHGAMEVFYSFYTKNQWRILKRLADYHHLLYSAGSDFHGDDRIKELAHYPYEIFKRMKQVASLKCS